MNSTISSLSPTAAPTPTPAPTTSSYKVLPTADLQRCKPSEGPDLIFGDPGMANFPKGAGYCQVNFPYRLEGLQRCCGGSELQIFNNCTQYCQTSYTEKTSSQAFQNWTYCVDSTLEAIGYNPGQLTLMTGCGKRTSLASRTVNQLPWIGKVIVLLVVAAGIW
ncbi:hypothetical protein BT63DRAFT_420554 [Microthyrium microscopicum]|uniref:Uncharacterized protein n=1 Tax=Microthyrium microscopicum TaxID=703497 RepID=A0A6A6USX9_9PEZI|nr:hypothetical protein BT63DRAFT_420554 [Microthyrium microscopicum]